MFAGLFSGFFGGVLAFVIFCCAIYAYFHALAELIRKRRRDREEIQKMAERARKQRERRDYIEP